MASSGSATYRLSALAQTMLGYTGRGSRLVKHGLELGDGKGLNRALSTDALRMSGPSDDGPETQSMSTRSL